MMNRNVITYWYNEDRNESASHPHGHDAYKGSRRSKHTVESGFHSDMPDKHTTHHNGHKRHKSIRGPHSPANVNLDQVTATVKMNRLKVTFGDADTDGHPGLNLEEFKTAVRKSTNSDMSDEEIQLIFMKMDVDCNGTIDWEEYVTYHMLTYQENSQLMQLITVKPFVNEMKSVQTKTHDAIVRILFFPHVTKTCTKYDFAVGKYVTLSKDGVVSFWTLSMKHTISYNTIQDDDRVNKPWFLDMTCIYNSNMVALTSTDRDIYFFDASAKSFLKRFIIIGLEHCVTCMDYWIDLRERKYGILMWGDTCGNIFALYFQILRGGGLFASTSDKKDTAKQASFAEIMRGMVSHIKAYKLTSVHEDWVCKIQYVPELKGFMSCCQRRHSALYLADFRKVRTPMYFKVIKGLTCFDYCSQLNVIVTGGVDYTVRIWNPYLTNRAIALLKGHTRPIIQVIVNGDRHQVMSIDKGKAINIFNLKDQSWIQHMSNRIVRLGPFPITAVCFNRKLHHLILATNHVGVLEQKYEERPTEVISHNKPIVIALYNKMFKVLVTACEGSVISVWDIIDGAKVMQFINAHSCMHDGIEMPVEITAMSFDDQEKRVITGARDGSVKVWNFNNGVCLQEFQTPESTIITGIVSTREQFYVTGWSKNIHIFIDGGGMESIKTWSKRHREDILGIAYLGPGTLATSSYDGDIILWAMDTGHAYNRLNAHRSHEPIVVHDTYTPEHILTHETNAVGLEVEDTDSVESGTVNKDDIVSEADNLDVTKNGQDDDANEASSTLEMCPLTPEVSNDPNSERRQSKCRPKSFKRGILAKVLDEGEGACVVDAPKKKIHEDVCQHPLLWALDKITMANQQNYQPKIRYSREDYDSVCKRYEAAVDTIMFLETRDVTDKNTATLLAAGAEGWVRAWSIHRQGGLLGQFNGAHKHGNSITTIVTDDSDRFLVTADSLGYVKVWDLTNYCTTKTISGEDLQKHREHMRKKFSFLKVEFQFDLSFNDEPINDNSRPPPQASNPEKTLKKPPLLSSFRAHVHAVVHVNFINDDFIVTCSSDQSIRMWTVCGRYIGTFGESWDPLPVHLDPTKISRPVPIELRRAGSAKTLWVLNGGKRPHWETALRIIRQTGLERLKKELEHLRTKSSTDLDVEKKQDNSSNILGKSYKRQMNHKLPPVLAKLYDTPTSIAVYHTLKFVDLSPIDLNHKPEVIEDINKRRLEAYTTKIHKGKDGDKGSRGAQSNRQRRYTPVPRSSAEPEHLKLPAIQ